MTDLLWLFLLELNKILHKYNLTRNDIKHSVFQILFLFIWNLNIKEFTTEMNCQIADVCQKNVNEILKSKLNKKTNTRNKQNF